MLTSMKLEAPFTRGTQKPQPPGFASMCDCDRETKDPCVCPLPVFPPVLPDQTTGRPRHSAAGLPALAAAGTSRRCPGGSRTASMRARSPSRRRNALLPKRADFGFLLGGAAHCSFLSCGWAAQTLVCAWLVVILWANQAFDKQNFDPHGPQTWPSDRGLCGPDASPARCDDAHPAADAPALKLNSSILPRAPRPATCRQSVAVLRRAFGQLTSKAPYIRSICGVQHGLARVGAASGKHVLHVLLVVFVAITGIATWTKVTV